jgi:c-di-GMP-binding flagellar brake protein YcgR
MIFKEQFKINDYLMIKPNLGDSNFFKSKILDIDFEKSIFLVEKVSAVFIKNTDVTIQKDWNEFNLVFQATIIEVNKENKLVINIPKQLNRIKKEEYYKLPLVIGVSVRKKNGDILLGESINVSANSICVQLNKELNYEDEVLVTIPFSKDFILENLEGVVKKVDKGDKLPYKCNIVYDYIEEAKRRQIINHIFKVQEMLLKFSNKV